MSATSLLSISGRPTAWEVTMSNRAERRKEPGNYANEQDKLTTIKRTTDTYRDRIELRVTEEEYYENKLGKSLGQITGPTPVTLSKEDAYKYGVETVVVQPKYTPPAGRIVQFRQTRVNEDLNQNIPIATSGGYAGGKIVASQCLQSFLQTLHTPLPQGPSMFDSPLAVQCSGMGRAGGGVVGGVAAIIDMVTQGIEMKDEVRKGRLREGIDAALLFTEAVGNLGESISVSANGFASLGVAATHVLAWTPPLAVASAFISLATIPYHMRGITRSGEILGDLQKSLDNNNDLQWLSKELSNPIKGDGEYYMRRQFGIINREKYAGIVKYIIENGKPETKQRMIGCLQERLKDRINSHRLAIVSAIIGVIGICIFFLCPPLVFLGLGIIGSGSLVSFARYVYDKYSVNALEKALDGLCSFDNIDQDWIRQHAAFAVPYMQTAKLEPTAVQMHDLHIRNKPQEEACHETNFECFAD